MAEGDMINFLIASLPLEQADAGIFRLRNYRGFWIPEIFFSGIVSAQDRYKSRDSDLLLVSSFKCGTTWLKALAFATKNRHLHHPSSPDHPLLLANPHKYVPHLERVHDLDSIPSPRLLATHMAHSLLPTAMTSSDSDCRIVYICRDPKDQFISGWHFLNQARPEPVPLGVSFESFCDGVFPFGPAWDHVLGYWGESRKRPSKVLFLTYEDMMEDNVGNLRRLAEFMGCPFSEAEESDGVAEDIVRLCSFKNLKEVEANSNSNSNGNSAPKLILKVSSFFRKGEVGDWKNYLTVEMAKKLDEITQQKWSGTGLLEM